MKINPKILEVLREFGIDEKDGLSYLLSIYFDCRPSYTPPVLTQKINVTRILGLDTTVSPAEVVWRIPLFKTGKDSRVNPKDSKWDWVKPWMEGFKSINSNRYFDDLSVFKLSSLYFLTNLIIVFPIAHLLIF